MKRFFRLAFAALALLTTMLLSASITLRVLLHAREIEIPDFSGMTVAEASTAALKTGVDLNIENRFYSTTVPAGYVLSQAPAAGSIVRHGWEVRVTESLGPQQVTIPNVVGQPLRQASMNIRRMSLDLGTLAHIGAAGDPDMTLAQTPPPGAGVDQPRVNLLLSSSAGDPGSAIVLPSFVGWSFPAANRAAIGLGLRVALIDLSAPAPTPSPAGGVAPGVAAPVSPSAPPNPMAPQALHLDASGEPIAQTVSPALPAQPPALPSGPVTAQSPESGFRASRGDTLRLILGHAPAAAATSPAPTPAAAPAAPAGTNPPQPSPTPHS